MSLSITKTSLKLQPRACAQFSVESSAVNFRVSWFVEKLFVFLVKVLALEGLEPPAFAFLDLTDYILSGVKLGLISPLIL